MSDRMHRLLVRHREQLYRFLNFEFKDHADGSLYLVFNRESRGTARIDWQPANPCDRTVVQSTEKLHISYHTSGRVNFHGATAQPIFCEPLFALTQPQNIGCISVPGATALSPAADAEGFATVELPTELDGRITFHLTLMPPGASPLPGTLAVINYENWFGIAVLVAPLPFEIPEDLGSHVIKAFPTKGKYASQQLSYEQALISFHQKRANTPASIVTSWQPASGVYRIVFAVPMRVPPRATIQFANPRVTAEIDRVTRSEIRFKARGPTGYIKSHPEPIVHFELESSSDWVPAEPG